MDTSNNLAAGFLASCHRFPDRPAIEVDGHATTYDQLRDCACSLAVTLEQYLPEADPPLVAILADRSLTAFAGVLGSLLRGHGYVPLNPVFPAERSRTVVELAGCQAIIVHPDCIEKLKEILAEITRPLLLILPEVDDVTDLAGRWNQHTWMSRKSLRDGDAWKPVPIGDQAIANLLFTSGSTGVPKGVMVTHRNVIRFIEVMCERYELSENDRFSQMFPLIFDLAGFDMFMSWQVGGCLACPSRSQMLFPGRYIDEAALTVWFSVPSTALLMKRLGMLEPQQYPNLRYSLFCGEALPADVTDAWAEAAPNSIVENLYGPTELTLACTLYRWDRQRSAGEAYNGIVPIGEPYPGMKMKIVDQRLQDVPPGHEGELLMAGPQRALGYWKNPVKTEAAFVVPPGCDEVYYRTGDLVRKENGGPLLYLGRIDHQIQLHGMRLEPGEIEAVLREEAGVDAAVVVGWPMTVAGVAEGLAAFLPNTNVDVTELRGKLAKRLSPGTLPRQIVLLKEFPINANGKVDRKVLTAMLDNDAES